MLAVALALLSTASPQDHGLAVYEPLVLPHVFTGEPDGWPQDDPRPRPVVNVLIDGRILFHGELVHDPSRVVGGPSQVVDGGLANRVGEVLALAAKEMEREPSDPDDAGSLAVPSGSILVRADLNAPFSLVREVMDLCTREGTEVRRVDLAVADVRDPVLDAGGNLVPTAEALQRMRFVLPLPRLEQRARDRRKPVALEVQVADPGRKLELDRETKTPWKGEPDTRFRWDLDTRVTEYHIAGRVLVGLLEFRKRLQGLAPQVLGRPFVVSVGPGATVAEVLLAVDSARDLGASEVRFAGVGERER